MYRARRRWSDRIKEIQLPLFPGYIFCRFPPGARARVLSAPGVASIVGFGGEPAVVDGEEIAALQRLVASPAFLQPWPYLKTGDRVQIVEGCLAGVTGLVVREHGKDACRVVVSVELLQRSVSAEVARDSVVPVSPRPASDPLQRPHL